MRRPALPAPIPCEFDEYTADIFENRVLRAALFAHLVAFTVIALARARLGGVTGDVLGLTVELAELAVLLTFAANSPSLGI